MKILPLLCLITVVTALALLALHTILARELRARDTARLASGLRTSRHLLYSLTETGLGAFFMAAVTCVLCMAIQALDFSVSHPSWSLTLAWSFFGAYLLNGLALSRELYVIALENNKNILFVGKTSKGKTTSFEDAHALPIGRLFVIEDCPEIKLGSINKEPCLRK